MYKRQKQKRLDLIRPWNHLAYCLTNSRGCNKRGSWRHCMIWRNLLIKRLPNSKHNFNSFLNNQRNILFEQWVHLFSSTPMRHVGCGWYISFLFQFNQTSLLLEFDIGPPGELFQLNSQTNPVTHDYRWGHMLLKVHCDYSNWQSNCVSTLEVCSTYPALGFDLNASSELSWCHQQHTAGKPATFRRKYNTGPLNCDGSVPACSAVSVDENNLSLIHISEPTRPLYISYAVFCLKK